MELNYEDLEKYLRKIFTGEDILYIDGKFVFFSSPSNKDKMKSEIIYKEAYSRAIDEGLLPASEIEALLYKRGIYTKSDDDKIDKLNSKLYAQEVLLAKTTKVKANQERIKKVISGLREQINTILYKKQSKLVMSAETRAEEDKSFFLCWSCTYKENGEKYWINYEDILLDSDFDFKNKVLSKFLIFCSGIDTSTIRFIARSNLWRIRYVTSQKVADSLFGVPTSQYTNDQLNLVYWSNYYQNVYDMMPEDRPSDDVIEDDEALDAYMKSYYEERTREGYVRKGRNRTGKLSAFNGEEVIVTQSNELYEDIKYDKPREAQKIKDKTFIKKGKRPYKRTRRRAG